MPPATSLTAQTIVGTVPTNRETAPKALKMDKMPLGTVKTVLGGGRKAAEGRRSPRRGALAKALGWRGAFWSAPVPWSFGQGWRGAVGSRRAVGVASV